MGENGKKYFYDHYAWEKIAAKYLKLIADLDANSAKK